MPSRPCWKRQFNPNLHFPQTQNFANLSHTLTFPPPTLHHVFWVEYSWSIGLSCTGNPLHALHLQFFRLLLSGNNQNCTCDSTEMRLYSQTVFFLTSPVIAFMIAAEHLAGISYFQHKCKISFCHYESVQSPEHQAPAPLNSYEDFKLIKCILTGVFLPLIIASI